LAGVQAAVELAEHSVEQVTKGCGVAVTRVMIAYSGCRRVCLGAWTVIA
jgi:hypothetical protein